MDMYIYREREREINLLRELAIQLYLTTFGLRLTKWFALH